MKETEGCLLSFQISLRPDLRELFTTGTTFTGRFPIPHSGENSPDPLFHAPFMHLQLTNVLGDGRKPLAEELLRGKEEDFRSNLEKQTYQ